MTHLPSGSTVGLFTSNNQQVNSGPPRQKNSQLQPIQNLLLRPEEKHITRSQVSELDPLCHRIESAVYCRVYKHVNDAGRQFMYVEWQTLPDV